MNKIFKGIVNIFKNLFNRRNRLKTILSIIIIVVIINILSFSHKNKYVIFNDRNLDNNVNNIKVVLEKKGEAIYYIYNGNSYKKYNTQVMQYLDKKEINYRSYDINKLSEDDYKKLLYNIKIDEDLFGTPAIVYIKNGVMYGNLINIKDTKVVEKFVKDYSLKKVKTIG